MTITILYLIGALAVYWGARAFADQRHGEHPYAKQACTLIGLFWPLSLAACVVMWIIGVFRK